ncbi:MAG: hypothetical protein WCC99_04060 [Candidatus Sulfotelmatobacter sp.]
MAIFVPYCGRSPSKEPMLRIQRLLNEGVVFSLTGRVGIEDIAELQRLFGLEATGHRFALDLEEVTLIDRDAVKFLASCEADSIRLENCPGYIRVWVDREKKREQRLAY